VDDRVARREDPGMSYDLTALIGAPGTLRPAVASLPGARVVELAAGLALVPLTGPVLAAIRARGGERATAPASGFQALTPAVARLAAGASAAGPVLYAEAEFFGGDGSQAAIGWRGGQVSFGPLHTQTRGEGREGFAVAAGAGLRGMALNAGLRDLGVRAPADGEAWQDEFWTAGLGRCRSTQDWR
jgi:hypothetical protein